jgi:predicted GNAT family N-acyltransferase
MGSIGIDDAYAIRRDVFIEEQHVPEAEEIDNTDFDAIHLVVYDAGKPIATGRMRITEEGLTIGRVAVLKPYRRQGFGDLVMRMLIHKAYEADYADQFLHAQLSARPFYETLDFMSYGPEFDEAGITHVKMKHHGDISLSRCE